MLKRFLKKKFKVKKFNIFLSLSDEKKYSIAYVIIEIMKIMIKKFITDNVKTTFLCFNYCNNYTDQFYFNPFTFHHHQWSPLY